MTYWSANNIDWSDATALEVVETSVYVVRKDDQTECIATRKEPRSAYGYADAISRVRRIPIRETVEQVV